MDRPLVSIVIPCYNQGAFIMDALESVKTCEPESTEIIIVNDGSTDSYTNELLENLSKDGYNVIFQKNTGLGGARNTGIQAARGEFILPLDADNRINPEYVTRGVEILNNNKEIAVVYSNANYFGDQTGILKQGEYSMQRIMLGNFIDACAVVRKSVMEEVGLYDNMKIMGYEDWDLWLRIAFKGYGFHYIDKALFDYRVTNDSMMKSLNRNVERQNKIEAYFKTKYADKLDFEYVYNYFFYKIKKAPFKFLYRFILKKYFPQYYNKQIQMNKMYNGWLYD
jgi:glycosyltransferase involved in cell wall biosynthesis